MTDHVSNDWMLQQLRNQPVMGLVRMHAVTRMGDSKEEVLLMVRCMVRLGVTETEDTVVIGIWTIGDAMN